ncbi:MAG: competence protein CoiA family protein [Ilumatobacter fluminis]
MADDQGTLVWADDLAAEQRRPTTLTCIGCGGRLVLRAGQRNAPHFAHYDANQCINTETALHLAAKRVIADSINAARIANGRYPARWYCGGCEDDRVVNLATDRVTAAVVEQNLGDVQPDIALLDADKSVRVVVEVVVTHWPEPAALDWYQANSIGVLCVEPGWDTLTDLRSEFTAAAAHHMTCRGWRHPHQPANRTCQCGQPLRSLRFEIAHGGTCWRDGCKRPLPALDVIEVFPDDSQHALRASDPTLVGIAHQARALGLQLRENSSKTENRRYLMHHCPACGAKAGDYFQYEHSADMTLVAGSEVRHLTMCAAGHWEVMRASRVPDVPPTRIVGPFISQRRSDDGWVGGVGADTAPRTVTARDAIRIMTRGTGF